MTATEQRNLQILGLIMFTLSMYLTWGKWEFMALVIAIWHAGFRISYAIKYPVTRS